MHMTCPLEYTAGRGIHVSFDVYNTLAINAGLASINRIITNETVRN